jgi:hypothetical protein
MRYDYSPEVTGKKQRKFQKFFFHMLNLIGLNVIEAMEQILVGRLLDVMHLEN